MRNGTSAASAQQTAATRPIRSEPASAPMMFWLLVLLGTVGLAPAVLLPVWHQFETVARAEQAEAWRRVRMEEAVAHQRRLLTALRTDPALWVRIAARERLLARNGSGSVAVTTVAYNPQAATLSPRERFFEPITPPALLDGLTDRVPDLDYNAVFCQEPYRTFVIVMSLGLFCAALALYGWRRDRAAI